MDSTNVFAVPLVPSTHQTMKKHASNLQTVQEKQRHTETKGEDPTVLNPFANCHHAEVMLRGIPCESKIGMLVACGMVDAFKNVSCTNEKCECSQVIFGWLRDFQTLRVLQQSMDEIADQSFSNMSMLVGLHVKMSEIFNPLLKANPQN